MAVILGARGGPRDEDNVRILDSSSTAQETVDAKSHALQDPCIRKTFYPFGIPCSL